MGTLILCFTLGCLLHAAQGGPIEGQADVRTAPDPAKLNGFWNIKAIYGTKIVAHLTELSYSYMEMSLSDKEANMTLMFNPIFINYFETANLQRVKSEKDRLTYKLNIPGIVGSIIISQLHHDSLIVLETRNDEPVSSSLLSRGISVPQAELEEFKQMGKSKNFTDYKEYNSTVNYAQTCHDLFKACKQLDYMKNDSTSSWHLIAKSSTSRDRNYELRILYSARLEISKKQGEYTLREIFTAPIDRTLLEKTFTDHQGPDVMVFQSGKDSLLLGIRNKKEKTLYLASKSPTVKQSEIDKFKAQAVCIETKHNYFVPLTMEMADEAADSCAEKLKEHTPINFKNSVGKWFLTASAHEKSESALEDIAAYYGITDIGVADGVVHLSHTSIHHGTIYLLEATDIEVKEENGHVLYKDTPQGKRAWVYRVSPNCIMFSPEILPSRHYLNCHAKQIPSSEDITRFVKYANCLKYNNIVIRRQTAPSCSELPNEVSVLDVNKIAGKWKLISLASNVPKEDWLLPPEIQFVVNGGEVTLTDGNWEIPAVKIKERRLQYAKGSEGTMEMRFYGPQEDALLVWVGNEKEQKFFVVLFTKSGQAENDDITRFKNLADCLSIPVAA